MAVVPTGILSEQLSDLRDLVAALSSWQVWLGVDGDPNPVASAETFLYMVDAYVSDQAGGEAPDVYGIVGLPDNFEDEAGGGVGTWRQRGTLPLHIEAKVLPADLGKPADEAFTFLNNVGAMLLEIHSLARVNGRMFVRRVSLNTIGRTGRIDKPVRGDSWGATWDVEFGVDSS